MEWIRKKDRAGVFEFVPRSSGDLLERFPQLARADLNTGMRLVMADGTVHVGADAVYHVARRLPFYRYPALLYRVPGLTQIGRWAYGWVAANRYRLAGRCDDDACRL